MADENPNKMDCPYICNAVPKEERYSAEAGQSRNKGKAYAAPYVPGQIQPLQPTIYPPGAPPTYLPQPTDSTSGDILAMGPIGPWAAGHVDWSPQSGITGVRPVVDKYSITRYCTGDWRKNNEFILTPRATKRARNFDLQTRKELEDAFTNITNKHNESNNMLTKRTKDLTFWKKEVQNAVEAMATEILDLDTDRSRLKGASRILMMPESISKECLELRSNRFEPDLVRDNAEQELIKEVAIVGAIRKVFNDCLIKVEHQMTFNKAAKRSIDGDWCDKLISLRLDIVNLNLKWDSSVLRYHPGVARWPENATSLEYWEHYCKESLKNCEEVRQQSINLRSDLMSAIVKGSQDMKVQADRTNLALSETIASTEALCLHLEANLKDNLQKIADVETLIDYISDSLRQLDLRNKVVMTRLRSRNYDRPNVENCRDEAQYALMAESKFTKETIDTFTDKLRQAEVIRAELMKYRGTLEKQITCKRKCLNIDKNRCSALRAHMPTPEEFAAG